MALRPGEEVGEAGHIDHDQLFRVEKGKGEVWIYGKRIKIKSDDAIIVPAAAKNNIVNTGNKSLRFYALCGPPDHRDGIVRATTAGAKANEELFVGDDNRILSCGSPAARLFSGGR